MKQKARRRKEKRRPRERPVNRATELQSEDGYWKGTFHAMASPCEALIETDDRGHAKHLLQVASEEAWRIERKLSRYRGDNIINDINNSDGKPVPVDDETARLLDFARQCHEISGGLFDITSGALRKVWKFDGSDRIPTIEQVDKVLPLVGWEKINWERPYITLPKGMEIDLGGIGKEYAVDRTLTLMREISEAAILVNFGGDVATGGIRKKIEPWRVGIEDPEKKDSAKKILEISSGALATSGSAYRFLMKNGKRYTHILDPRTGWPVTDAPRSVTVADDTCTNSGIIATLALLQGAGAEEFLKEQDVRYWCLR